MILKAVKVIVSGMVQGVGFRYFTYRRALQNGLNGFVRNVYDGTVEIQAEGHPENLDNFIIDIRKGPSLARVDNVEVDFSIAPKHYNSFEIRP